jgi:HPr kinase/phosphorylase
MSATSQHSTITVEQFLESAQDQLELSFFAGENHLQNQIEEPSLNRPGLIFSGFQQYFAHRRIQVMGLAELSYLKSLAESEQASRLETFYSRAIPLSIVTRNRKPSVLMQRLAEKHRVPLMRSPLITMDLISQATVILDNLMSPKVQLHGTMMDIRGIGVMIEGDPGVGKSEVALTLIEKGHSLVSDDVTILRASIGGALIGTSAPVTRHHMEIRGLGIIHVPSLFGVSSIRDAKQLDLIIRLVGSERMEDVDRTGLTNLTKDVLGVKIPYHEVPVAAGRDMGHVVEVACLNQKLKYLGHDAAKELDEKLLHLLSKRAVHE